mmetsp:Transcript_25977/g.75757  ORF Transcript_25977/g.75757 Transcript_25977/m.75757 type:complete len:235 (+) Transcript_25977:375-1079(+)
MGSSTTTIRPPEKRHGSCPRGLRWFRRMLVKNRWLPKPRSPNCSELMPRPGKGRSWHPLRSHRRSQRSRVTKESGTSSHIATLCHLSCAYPCLRTWIHHATKLRCPSAMSSTRALTIGGQCSTFTCLLVRCRTPSRWRSSFGETPSGTGSNSSGRVTRSPGTLAIGSHTHRFPKDSMCTLRQCTALPRSFSTGAVPRIDTRSPPALRVPNSAGYVACDSKPSPRANTIFSKAAL